jgi:hypothetical protein
MLRIGVGVVLSIFRRVRIAGDCERTFDQRFRFVDKTRSSDICIFKSNGIKEGKVNSRHELEGY